MPDATHGQVPAPTGRLHHLSVHPSVVFKLGEDLITDDVQALIELVKNAYDADSSSARIIVDTQVWTDPVTGAEVPAAKEAGSVQAVAEGRAIQGRITVTDRGTGMTYEDIRRGWLTVSASAKRAMKQRGEVTAKKRTPLGDKGLGRLGAQRLGTILEIDTVPQSEDAVYSVRIPWQHYEQAESLDDVDLEVVQAARGAQRTGTTITIRGLREPTRWRGDGLNDLERDLSTMLSPYGDRGFDVRLQVDGEPIDLRRLSREVRAKSLLHYHFAYEGGSLSVTGRISTAFLRPNSEKDEAEYRVLVEDDHGAAFRNWLMRGARAKGLGISAGDDHYFIEVRTTRRLADLVGVRMIDGKIADPGPFSGELDSVALRTNPTDVFNTNAEYRDYVRKINGVRIYRDGFGIKTSEDWLGLGKKWTKGTSWYNLRPENVVGYIDLSAAGNANLVETTNREGFQDTFAYRNFVLLLDAWLEFTETVQSVIRRGWNEYKKECALAVAKSDVLATPQMLSDRARARLKNVQTHAARSGAARASVAKTVEKVRQAVGEDKLFGGSPEMLRALDQARDTLEQIDQLVTDAERLVADYNAQVAELDLLRVQVDTIQEQLADTWEAVSLGITAEALSHEVHLVADRLRARSLAVARHIDQSGLRDTAVSGYIEHVRSAAAALNRQLTHLNPALRYMRERRSTIALGQATAEIISYYTEKWANRRLSITRDVVRDFTIQMNAGKLTQVLDNLILNSEFWLIEQQRQGVASSGTVRLTVESPCVTFTDTGPGIDPAVEDLLFEPFVTTKGRGKGRGLGLFVVRQLLDTEAATIELDPDRSPDGRRRTFRLTFTPSPAGPMP